MTGGEARDFIPDPPGPQALLGAIEVYARRGLWLDGPCLSISLTAGRYAAHLPIGALAVAAGMKEAEVEKVTAAVWGARG